MNTNIVICRATVEYAAETAEMVGELLSEIMQVVGIKAFNFDLRQTTTRIIEFIERKKYFIFVARHEQIPVGFVSLCESYALYTEGAFGIIPEFYVRSAYRSNGVGAQLVSYAKSFGRSRDWTRLEVTTPPLPLFDKTLAFYERQGFSITGGRKLKLDF